MSFKRYGVIYKSKHGREYLVTTNHLNEAWASSNLEDTDVLAFHSEEAIAKFMKRSSWTVYPDHSRHKDGDYRVIELEPIYALVRWQVKGDN